MSSIIPAVIPESRKSLEEALRVFAPFSREVQIDIVDGVFVPAVSWPYVHGGEIQEELQQIDLSPFNVEFDLMIKDPEVTLDLWSALNPARIVVHIESTTRLDAIFEHRRAHNYQLGLAVNNDTALEMLTAVHRDSFDYVELMGIDQIGVQGQPFDERVLSRVRRLREMYPDLLISIDGSVNEASLPQLKEAGATRFVAGSAILKADDSEAMYKKLSALAA